jgi:hypothetical protein
MSGMKRKTKKNGRPIIHSRTVTARDPINKIRLICHSLIMLSPYREIRRSKNPLLLQNLPL